MFQQNKHKALTAEQIKILEQQGCVAQDWQLIKAADGFNASAVRAVQFVGQVQLGKFTGNVKSAGGIEKPSGIYNATIANCTIADDVRVSNIGVHIANYDIEPGACIENVTTMQTGRGATFGNGVEVAVLNEAGGREVMLFDELSSQFAYLMCLHRYEPKLIKKLTEIAGKYADKVRSDKGRVGSGAQIIAAGEIVDVNVGSAAVINGAASLVNGTILSCKEAPAVVGTGVVARDFIIAEGAVVNGSANLDKVFIGQGSRVGRQFSAENSLFFANSEAFHGEACSVFAGPYTVTHHKSTLLIAGLFSFYNAGSGTNQSNHMYKLGPTHEGKLERGTKTGSFSYMMWPCVVGPFSVVLGKHTRTFDTCDFPFTHLEAEPDGKCTIVPGMHLITVGTVRDGAKWPTRDRRKAPEKRDIILFDVFSPYTVGKMIRGSSVLKELGDNTDRSVEWVHIKGTQMKRVLLRTSQKFYRTGIEMYLLEKVLARAEEAVDGGIEKVRRAFAAEPAAVYSREWVDISGQLMPKQRMLDLSAAIESGKITDIDSFSSEVQKIYDAYAKDEWAWVEKTYREVFGVDLGKITKEEFLAAVEAYLAVRTKFLKLVLVDAEKEFDSLSRTGFGYNGTAEDIDEDFHQVRGQYDENEFVREIRKNIEEVEARIVRLKEKASACL